MRNEYCGKMIMLGDWKNYQKENIKQIKRFGDGVIVSHSELMDYAKKLHKSRYEYEEFKEDIKKMKEIIHLIKSFKTAFSFLKGDLDIDLEMEE